MSDYTPTTEEIREYVEVGGEPALWLPPTPERDAARAAAFDRWLDAHDRRVAATALREAAGDSQLGPVAHGWNASGIASWLRSRADRFERGGEGT